jgi:hypothetical protein
MDAFVGFDFGKGGEKEFGKVRVDWGKSPPSEVVLESAGRFQVIGFSAAGPFSEHQLGDGIGAHRLWRMQIRQVPPEVEIAVREVRFLEDREQAPNANAPKH